MELMVSHHIVCILKMCVVLCGMFMMRSLMVNVAEATALKIISSFVTEKSTYDHRVWKTGLPVRSAVLKPHAGRLVVGWVTTSESRLLYVFFFFFFCSRGHTNIK